jgi:hypothetical protein
MKNTVNTTRTQKQQHVAPSQEVEDRINKTLAATDWNKYWERVSDRVAKEVDAYALARAKSLEDACHHVFM